MIQTAPEAWSRLPDPETSILQREPVKPWALSVPIGEGNSGRPGPIGPDGNRGSGYGKLLTTPPRQSSMKSRRRPVLRQADVPNVTRAAFGVWDRVEIR